MTKLKLIPSAELVPAEVVPSLKEVLAEKRQKKAAKEPKEAKETKAPFEVLEDTKDIFKSRIQINSNDIKHMMAVNDSELVGPHSFIPDDMTGKERDRAEAASRYDVLSLISDGKATNWLRKYNQKEFDSFVKILNEFDQKFEKIFSTVKNSDRVQFNLLPYFIKENDLIAVLRDNTTWVGLKVSETKIRYSWSGVSFDIKGKVIHHDGKSFKEALISHSIGFFEGDKTFPEIGIKLPAHDENIRKLLIERGKKYERIHANGPAYLMNNGSIVRRSWWLNHEFPAIGRVMIDRRGMVNIDPNYDKYFGTSRYNDEEENQEADATLTDNEYMITSPYCYGFSFVAKQWGEIHIDQLSEIKFRDDSYSQLVLNSETKDILFSLTDTSEHGKDLIDSKGGGCIFLLHGTPGVGK